MVLSLLLPASSVPSPVSRITEGNFIITITVYYGYSRYIEIIHDNDYE